MKAVHTARAVGRAPRTEMAGHPVDVTVVAVSAHKPFTVRPSYKELESLPIEEQRRRLRDPEMRRKILADVPSDAEIAKLAQFRQVVTKRFDKFFVMGNPPDYEPGPEKSVAAIAQREGRTPEEVAYDYILEDGQYLYFPVVNYVTGDHGPILEMLHDPACLLGLSDGGAHCTSIVDAGVPTYMLTHWARDRERGPNVPRELLGKRQTSETADFFGLNDRGRLAPGMRADVNVIDFKNLQVRKPEIVHDMPADGRRFVQRVEGYEATIVAGTPLDERGEHTGALPGRLVRAGRVGMAMAAE
jgi:N-acyl-D-aspartate/D-glutamate deacylase